MHAVWRRPSKRGAATPLVVFLHGRGADELDLIDLAGALPRSFAFVSFRAPIALAEGGYNWFESRSPARPVPSSLRDSIELVRSWLDAPEIRSQSRRCYLFGFSAGMMMASALMLDEPSRFAGGVFLSGAIPLDSMGVIAADRLAERPIFYGHGTNDRVIPAELVAQTRTYLERQSGAELTLREYPHAHEISSREMSDIDLWFRERE